MESTVNSPNSREPTNTPEPTHAIAEVVSQIRSKGVRLWTQDGQLRYKAPKGALTPEEIHRLSASKVQILALLDTTTQLKTHDNTRPKDKPSSHLNANPNAHPNTNPNTNPNTGPNDNPHTTVSTHQPQPPSYHAPLTYSQRAHWQFFGLAEHPSVCLLASATRLRGRLSIDALRKSLAELTHRHDALRTRIVMRDGTPLQEIADSAECELTTEDLSALPEQDRETEITHAIEDRLLRSLEVTREPLVRISVLRLRPDEHVLAIAIEHLVTDAVSMNILLRELLTAYAQTLRGHPVSLTQTPVQFGDYTHWQRHSEPTWIRTHGAYWSERLKGSQRLRFPADTPTPTGIGWGTSPIRIDTPLRTELQEWCRLRQTTLVMSVFTAYAALVLRWCAAPEAVFQYQIDGRSSAKIENTLGYFAGALYLRIQLRDKETLAQLLTQVTDEYCRAYEHTDSSYLAAQLPRPEFTRNTAFNWVPQGPKTDLRELAGTDDAIELTPVPFVHPMPRTLVWDNEPAILLYDTDSGITGDIYFPANRFSPQSMERLGRNFLMLIRALLHQPEQPIQDILLI